MNRRFDQELLELRSKVLSMGGLVEAAVEDAVNALLERAPDRIQKVYASESKINQFHLDVDEFCLQALARNQPIANDLRAVMATIKINNDLERMGDQAVNIAQNAKHYLSGAPVKDLIDIPQMATAVKKMIREALDSFVKQDLQLAKQVLETDDVVDNLKHKVFRDLIPLMQKNPALIERSLDLILIARNLERLGDHATNIAEDVIFLLTGKDIRHGGQ